jgi:transposase
MEQLDFNLLFRWFVGLNMDEAVWDHSTFSQNRDRLLTEALTHDFFSRVVAVAERLWSAIGRTFQRRWHLD